MYFLRTLLETSFRTFTGYPMILVSFYVLQHLCIAVISPESKYNTIQYEDGFEDGEAGFEAWETRFEAREARLEDWEARFDAWETGFEAWDARE